MKYAILSDVHGHLAKLKAVLADAQARGVEQIVSLGDVGGPACLDLLRDGGAIAVFGNYEVSGWSRLEPEHRSWVRSWPPLVARDSYVAVHAAPFWPEGLLTIEDFGRWIERTGRSWRSLFPYITEDQGYVWKALVELEAMEKAILFHGHTHRQAIWCWAKSGRLEPVPGSAIQLEAGHRYVIGVGSVGLPDDGGWATYAFYDANARRVELVRLDPRSVPGDDV
jgi:diadenosine tetraphosphatase ApaH/serine/threonine PP2A family protein phosphatase